jgi:signal transduction histidine kinase
MGEAQTLPAIPKGREVFPGLLQVVRRRQIPTKRRLCAFKSLRWNAVLAFVLPAYCDPGKDTPAVEEQSAFHGMPFTRSYPLEEIGDVPRGATLTFDRFGRLAVVHDGFYSVLNDTTWLDLADRTSGDVSMPVIFQSGSDAYFGGFGTWGIVEQTAGGKVRPHPLVPVNPPKWVRETRFTDITVTKNGVFFAGWDGIVYWDFASHQNQFFKVFGFSKIFSVGEDVFVSNFESPIQRVDIVGKKLQPIAGTNFGDDAIAQGTSLDAAHSLISTRSGQMFLFDGAHLAPWPGQTRNGLSGRITSMCRLEEGGVAFAIEGKGLYLATEDGEITSALTGTEFHRITHLATREAGVLWAGGEDAIQKVLYGSAVTVFGQRLGLNASWPLVGRWNDKIVVTSSGTLFEAVPAANGAASRFEAMKSQPAAGAWALAASGSHLLIGNGKGTFEVQSDGNFPCIVPNMDVARLAMIGSDVCFAIGRLEIAVIRLSDGHWTECAPRIPSIGYPSVAHSSTKAVWVELGPNRVARLSLQGGRIRVQNFEDFPWKVKHWVNVGIVDDTVVLSGSPGDRIFYDENTESFCAAPELQSLLDQAPDWILRVQRDESGTLWATHEKGVITYIPKDGEYRIDTTTFDLNNEHFPLVQLLPGNDVWLSTSQSLYHVDQLRAFGTGSGQRPPRRFLQAAPILVSVTDGRTNAELIGDPRASAGPLRLPYSTNNLTFRFFSGSYARRHSPVYEFMLSGGQTQWTSIGSGSLLNFRGLHDGTYYLSVRIANPRGSTSPPTNFRFDILPPWYMTWFAYSLYILAAALAVLGLMRWSARLARRRNLALESIVRERTDQLKVTMQKLNDETRNSATLAERDRLAGEIHDSLQQGLSGLMLQLDATLKLPAITGDVRSRLNVARNMVSFTRHEVQHAIWDMESPLLEGTELDDALGKIAALIDPGVAKIEISVSGPSIPLPSATQHHLLRIAQEAITNAVRHAGPTTISVNLEYRTGAVLLAVCDNGAGFEPNDVLEKSIGHFGLRGLRGRASKIGGELRIESAPGRGTLIEIIVPLAEHIKDPSDAATISA